MAKRKTDICLPKTLQFPEYISQYQREQIQSLYDDYFQEYKNKTNNNLEIVPYELRLKGIKDLVENADFKKLWIKIQDYPIRYRISSIYIKYFGNNQSSLREVIPNITLRERNSELNRAVKNLESFIKIMDSDASLRICLSITFIDAIQKVSPNIKQFLPEHIFFNAIKSGLYEQIRTNKIDTHKYLPRQMKDKNMVYRGDVIGKIASTIKHIYGRNNYVLVGKILNVLRPDLGPFSSDNIRKRLKE